MGDHVAPSLAEMTRLPPPEMAANLLSGSSTGGYPPQTAANGCPRRTGIGGLEQTPPVRPIQDTGRCHEWRARWPIAVDHVPRRSAVRGAIETCGAAAIALGVDDVRSAR